TDVPRAGQGQVIGGRRQIETGRSAHQYLASFPQGEIGWTPETYASAFMTTLERTGRVLDRHTQTLLTAAYLPASGCGPLAFWDPGYRQAHLGGGLPDFVDPGNCAPAAVRVL